MQIKIKVQNAVIVHADRRKGHTKSRLRRQ